MTFLRQKKRPIEHIQFYTNSFIEILYSSTKFSNYSIIMNIHSNFNKLLVLSLIISMLYIFVIGDLLLPLEYMNEWLSEFLKEL